MKAIRKLMIGVLIAAMVITPNKVHASDEDKVSLEIQKAELRQLGVPQDYISLLPSEKVRSMYNRYCKNSTRSNSDEIHYEWAGYEVTVKDVIDGKPETRGTIPTAKLQLTISYMNEVNGNRITGIVVETLYRWLTLPAYLDEDGMIVNWQSSMLNSDGFYSDCGGEFIEGQYNCFQFTTTPTLMTNGGYAWKCPLTSGKHPGELPLKLYGGGSMHLYPVEPMYTYSDKQCEIIVEYHHKYLTIVGGIKFTVTGAKITLSNSTNVDSLIHHSTWKSSVRADSN